MQITGPYVKAGELIKKPTTRNLTESSQKSAEPVGGTASGFAHVVEMPTKENGMKTDKTRDLSWS